MEWKASNKIIEAIRGDISSQKDITAIVNAANAKLAPGGGVAGAIHSAAGPGLYEACKPLAPINPGEAVITPAFNLSNDYVIHCLGPVYGQDKPEKELLEACYKNTLKICNEKKIDSVAFPAISTGIFGYPSAEAAEVAIKTVILKLQNLEYPKKVRFVLFSDQDRVLYEEKLKILTA